MEIIQDFTFSNLNLNLILVILIIAGGFFQKKYWTSVRLSGTIKTLIISTIFTLIYLSLTCEFTSFADAKPCLLTGFVSYAVATSFYEVIIKKLPFLNQE